ncbi:MAG: DUF1570 domain-containing protein [Planctomycetota bacterium]
MHQNLGFVGEEYEQVTTRHFVLLHRGDARWARRTGKLLELAREEFYITLRESGFKPAQPDQPLVWVCFPETRPFRQYARQSDDMDASWLEAYYSTRTNRVATIFRTRDEDSFWTAGTNPEAELREDVARIVFASDGDRSQGEPAEAWQIDVIQTTHELAHQLAFNTGLQKRGVMYPLWVSEGLATNFEADPSGEIGFGRDNAIRRRRLVAMNRDRRLMPLGQFLTLTQVPRNGRAKDFYAQSWGMFHFLFTRRSKQMRRYLQAIAQLKPGRRSRQQLYREFTTHFGSMRQLRSDWRAYLRDAGQLDQDSNQPQLVDSR